MCFHCSSWIFIWMDAPNGLSINTKLHFRKHVSLCVTALTERLRSKPFRDSSCSPPPQFLEEHCGCSLVCSVRTLVRIVVGESQLQNCWFTSYFHSNIMKHISSTPHICMWIYIHQFNGCFFILFAVNVVGDIEIECSKLMDSVTDSNIIHGLWPRDDSKPIQNPKQWHSHVQSQLQYTHLEFIARFQFTLNWIGERRFATKQKDIAKTGRFKRSNNRHKFRCHCQMNSWTPEIALPIAHIHQQCERKTQEEAVISGLINERKQINENQ